MTSRRLFILSMVCADRAAASPPKRTALQPLREDDPRAVALGYVADAARVDRNRFRKFTPGSDCSRCDLYQAPPDAPWAACDVFPGALVAGPGWCDVYVTRRKHRSPT
jgi:hypothetical protein